MYFKSGANSILTKHFSIYDDNKRIRKQNKGPNKVFLKTVHWPVHQPSMRKSKDENNVQLYKGKPVPPGDFVDLNFAENKVAPTVPSLLTLYLDLI